MIPIFRITKSDIERNTILLPDLRMARVGDIVVNNINKTPHIGIIVSANFSSLPANATTDDYMENITVVSVSSGYRMANVGVWKNPYNVTSGFTAPGEEKSYHLRRLLIKPSDVETLTSYQEDSFEVFDTELTELDIDLDIDIAYNNRLIPNTGELLRFKSIKIKGKYGEDIVSMENEDSDVAILPPLDQYYFDQSDTDAAGDKSNIYRNRGTGLKFYATDGKNNILLATFKLKTTSSLIEGDSPYSVEYNTDIFESKVSSRTKDGFRLYVDGDKLKFKVEKPSVTAYNQFAVRPIEGGIRPGDDFLLQFGLQKNETISGAAKDYDAIAVYDQKMLWRANLYLKENSDWNNLHPWNAPPELSGLNFGSRTGAHYNSFSFITATGSSDTNEKIWYGANEWNRVYNGESRLSANNEPTEAEYLNPLDVGNGGQVVTFNEFTYIENITGEGNSGKDKDVVAYSYGCNDNPFEFNDELRQQQDVVTKFYNKNKEKFNKIRYNWLSDTTDITQISKEEYEDNVAEYTTPVNGGFYPDGAISLEPYTGENTTAIDNKYSAYIRPSDMLYSDNFPLESNNTIIDGNVVNLPETLSFPFLPGYSLKHYFTFKDTANYDYPPNWINAISAGVDCIGFVSRSASYTENKYKWNDVNPETIHNSAEWYIGINYPTYGANGDSYLISENIIGSLPKNLDKVKPGDIMYIPGHIAIVRSVGKTNGEVTLSDIKLIESTWYDWNKVIKKHKYAKVTNSRTLNNYSGSSWKIVRLKETN